ncbi:Nuclease EXOG, mitochondrial [Holothuria leucospilota]|uniref:Nuclease EXOG, mitochondrial n=1 Tax=Holothuria leucospilota TaxID=206669 RepID=A0A9Q0YLT2_HOLLE|nr:Nuclease EXOG, mitochondrial [Holothuria leucospilota]
MSLGSPRFFNGFLSGTLCTALAFYFYKTDDYKETSSDRLTQVNLHAKESYHLTDVDPETAKQLRGREILKYGIPDRGFNARLYTNHVLCYDQAKKIPVWVAELITKSDLRGHADREYSNFRMDPTLDEFFSSHNNDFIGSGWSRGHMAPAGDNKFSQRAMDETFYLTNIVPQDISNNDGFWNRLEIYCRDLTNKFKEVRVISGSLTLPTVKEGSKKFVNYEVIGNNSVTVPTHLFKVVTAENPQQPGSPVAVGAFVIPNQPIEGSAQLTQYKVRLEDLEKSAGVYFLPRLPPSKRVDLCSIDSCQLISQEALELYFVGRKLEDAKTLERLDSVWKDLERRHLVPDDYLIHLYKRKRESLSPRR